MGEKTLYVALALIAALAPQPALAQRANAELACRFAGADFVYDCTIRLARGGTPLEGAQVALTANMPSMPLAHNLPPVRAAVGARPGEYTARLDLGMKGDWAMRLRIAGPLNDVLVLHYRFDEKGARPAGPPPVRGQR